MTSKTTIDQPTQNDATRPIRILTTLPIIFTIAFAIPYSVDNESVLPALGVLPMAFSACTGVYQVTGSKKRSRALTLTLDIFCACFLFSLFVPSLVVMAGGRWYRYSEEVVIGTLGAATMMLNLLCHLWFISREMRWPKMFSEKTCPHCHRNLRTTVGKHGYIRVAEDDEEEGNVDDSGDHARSHPCESYTDGDREDDNTAA